MSSDEESGAQSPPGRVRGSERSHGNHPAMETNYRPCFATWRFRRRYERVLTDYITEAAEEGDDNEQDE